MSPIIELRNVEKSYPQGAGQVWVLRRIDLTVEEGEFVSISCGRSGSGKRCSRPFRTVTSS